MGTLIDMRKMIEEELERLFENEYAWEMYEILYDNLPIYILKDCAPALDLRGLEEVDCIWRDTE